MLAEGYPDHPAGVDRLAFYEFDVDWATPGNTTFTMVDEIPIADYNYTVCGFFVGDCIPQPGTAQELDSLSYWPMWRFGYRNLGSYEALVGNFTVDVNGADRAAIRWFELRDSGSGWDLHQEGTHAPDSDHRWMGSIAMDGSGNIALGYSVSSGTTIPSIRYATRLASDPLGTLQAEENVITGGTQTGGASRWGDYSSMSVDPADDCTFWYTNEYHDVNATAFNWNTRIVVFRIPECTGALFPDFSLTADPTTYETCTTTPSVDYNITVSSIMSFTDQVDLSVLGNPAGTTTSFTVDPVTPPGSSVLTIGSLGSAVAGSYSIDIVGTAPTSTHTTTVGLDLYTAAPGTVTLTAPADGATGVGLAPTLTWTADANATEYYVEVATDMGFSNIVFTDTVVATSVNLSGLSTLTTYYWRVTPNNICGAGPSSAVFSFTTADGSLLCNVGAVGFEGGLPGDWLVTNDSPNNNAIVWGTTADAPATCGIANSTTGSGVAACADSDFPGSANSPAYDTSLVTNPFSTLPLSTVTLNVAGFYRDLGVGNDLFRVEVWDGSSWVTELSWDENHQTAGSGDITLDLSDYAGDSNTQVRFRYSGNGWDWYAQVDDVELTCVGGGTDLGYLTGTVTDSDTSGPISGADIMVDDGTTTYNLATDGSGVYTSSLPIGTYTITASATGYFSEMVSGITVATDATTVQDFDLGPAFVEIAVNPTEMEATVSVDGTADQTLTIWNMGTLDLDWTITEIAARANTAQATGGVPQRLQLFAPQPNPKLHPQLSRHHP
ncbi:MAG: carboxypeptidase regulatory-like domain-containing protein [Chloroflexi bacterium]|nr:carboxypeptidase regulatory-like domain-containing protein [Chloroflexota bacterium]